MNQPSTNVRVANYATHMDGTDSKMLSSYAALMQQHDVWLLLTSRLRIVCYFFASRFLMTTNNSPAPKVMRNLLFRMTLQEQTTVCTAVVVPSLLLPLLP